MQSSIILFFLIGDGVHLLRGESFPNGNLLILFGDVSERGLVHGVFAVEFALAAGIVNTAHIAQYHYNSKAIDRKGSIMCNP